MRAQHSNISHHAAAVITNKKQWTDDEKPSEKGLDWGVCHSRGNLTGGKTRKRTGGGGGGAGLRPTGRPAATALFLGGGTVSRGSAAQWIHPRSACSGKGLSRNCRGWSHWDATRPDGTRSHRPGYGAPSRSFLGGGNSAGFSGRICFYHSFLLFFVLHLLVSKLSSILIHVDKKRWHPFDQPLRKIPQIPGISVEGVSGKIIGLIRRHRTWGTFGRTGIARRV